MAVGNLGVCDAAAALLLAAQARPNSTCLFVPAEITSYCFYGGKEKPRMVANVIFRYDIYATPPPACHLLHVRAPAPACLSHMHASWGPQCLNCVHRRAARRMGGAAALLTNKRALIPRCKYQLLHNVRVHTGADDSAYK